jgi:hypothetical protein
MKLIPDIAVHAVIFGGNEANNYVDIIETGHRFDMMDSGIIQRK